jgi:hypothetical protein
VRIQHSRIRNPESGSPLSPQPARATRCTLLFTMLITGVQTLRCGAGFRDFCFVKISTDGVAPGPDAKPIVGWSEILDERNTGLDQAIQWMGGLVTGKDPLPYATLVTQLKSNTRHIVGGIANQAIAAIENALLDIVGKAYGVPVAALFGGPYRTEMPAYWSHCGSFRVSFAEHLHKRTRDNQVTLCACDIFHSAGGSGRAPLTPLPRPWERCVMFASAEH